MGDSVFRRKCCVWVCCFFPFLLFSCANATYYSVHFIPRSPLGLLEISLLLRKDPSTPMDVLGWIPGSVRTSGPPRRGWDPLAIRWRHKPLLLALKAQLWQSQVRVGATQDDKWAVGVPRTFLLHGWMCRSFLSNLLPKNPHPFPLLPNSRQKTRSLCFSREY